jgi:hypothetical protein
MFCELSIMTPSVLGLSAGGDVQAIDGHVRAAIQAGSRTLNPSDESRESVRRLTADEDQSWTRDVEMFCAGRP